VTRLAPRPLPEPEGAPAPSPWPRADPIERLPILILYPHSRCNCRCLMCDIWRDRGRREIGADEVAGWLPEWRELGIERVVLSGGEPLLHSELPRLGGMLAAAGIGVTVLSTGLLLARDAEALVGFADDLVVSLDGPPEVHDEIRNVPRAFAKLEAGVAAVRAAADRAGRAGRRVAISGRTTVQRANFRHLRATVAAARGLGLDRLSFLAADVTSEAFTRPGGWDAERAAAVAPAAAELPALAAELDALEREAAADFASGFIAEGPAKLRRRLLGHFAALAGQADFEPPACNAPWVSAVVEADGTVRPCFFQPPLGDLRRDGGLAAVLNSPAARAFRRRLDPARDAICRRCVCSLELRRGDEVQAVEGGRPAAGAGDRR
jgi:MoaA/NifB/PqqE/SkfB family radical SAM enzyme